MSAPGDKRKAVNTREDWETPWEFFTLLPWRFTVDLAASPGNTKVPRFVTREQDSFKQEFKGETIWCNPPYGRELSRWAELFKELGRENTVVALLPAATDTQWFYHVWDWAKGIIFLTGRINFIGSTSTNPVGSMLAVYDSIRKPNRLPHSDIVLWDWKKEDLSEVYVAS